MFRYYKLFILSKTSPKCQLRREINENIHYETDIYKISSNRRVKKSKVGKSARPCSCTQALKRYIS